MSNALAIILAGGKGERMGQLCLTRPKPTLPVAGDLKVIDFCLNNCLNSGIRQIAIITGYQGDQIAHYAETWAEINNGHSHIHLLPPKNGLYEGTADAIWQNAAFVEKNGFEWIIILAADHIYKMDYGKFIQAHCSSGADMTIAVASVPMSEASRYGVVTTNTDGRIIEFQEKPPVPAGNLASMGIYIFNRKALLDCLTRDAGSLFSAHDFGYSVIPQMVANKKVFAYRFNGYWRDIGTVESYYQTNTELIDELSLFHTGKRWPALGHALELQSSQGNIVHSLISPGCVVKGRVENSILSAGVTINEHAVVRDSIIMTGSSVGEYSHVDRSIVSEDVSIGRFCYVGIKRKPADGQSNITIIGPSYSIPSHTPIDSGSHLSCDRDLAVSVTETGEVGCLVAS